MAEVLITLTIIGVVAAMTIPTLMSKHNDQVTTVKLKKVQSILANAVKMAQSQGALNLDYIYLNDLSKYLKYARKFAGNPFDEVLILPDGIILGMHNSERMASTISVIVNQKYENVLAYEGKWGVQKLTDWYSFQVFQNGSLVPNGAPNTVGELKKEDTCPHTIHPDNAYSTRHLNGCTYWTIKTGKVKKKAGEWFE